MYTLTFVGLAFLPGMTVTWAGLASIFISHYFIDICKGRWGIIKQIWVDQLCHLAMLPPLVLLGWL